MKALLKALMAAALLGALPAAAQVYVEVEAPKIRFEVAPALVVVAPGVQVVPDYDDEVFVVGPYYYVRRGPRWYRAHGHHGRWHHVKSVPRELVHIPHGKYRRFKPHGHAHHGRDHHGGGHHRGGGAHHASEPRRGDHGRDRKGHDKHHGKQHDKGSKKGHSDGKGRR